MLRSRGITPIYTLDTRRSLIANSQTQASRSSSSQTTARSPAKTTRRNSTAWASPAPSYVPMPSNPTKPTSSSNKSSLNPGRNLLLLLLLLNLHLAHPLPPPRPAHCLRPRRIRHRIRTPNRIDPLHRRHRPLLPSRHHPRRLLTHRLRRPQHHQPARRRRPRGIRFPHQLSESRTRIPLRQARGCLPSYEYRLHAPDQRDIVPWSGDDECAADPHARWAGAACAGETESGDDGCD